MQELDISHPGKNGNIISPSEATERNKDFFASRPEDESWILRVRHLDGRIEEFSFGVDWEAVSKFGAVRSAVVTNPDGSPAFDRPRYDEAPNINAVVFGKDERGRIMVAIISQGRPHADNVFEEDTEPMIFESIPMGFMNKIMGNDQLERLEHAGEAAARESMEESGVQVVKDILYPEYPQHYPNPTFVGTTSNVVFVEVDLKTIDKMRVDRKELIFSAEYISLSQLLRDIEAGKTERGYARMATTNSVILMFLSTLKAFQNAERNEHLLNAETQANKDFKKENPEEYIAQRLRVSRSLHPDKFEKNKEKARKYLDKAV